MYNYITFQNLMNVVRRRNVKCSGPLGLPRTMVRAGRGMQLMVTGLTTLDLTTLVPPTT